MQLSGHVCLLPRIINRVVGPGEIDTKAGAFIFNPACSISNSHTCTPMLIFCLAKEPRGVG